MKSVRTYVKKGMPCHSKAVLVRYTIYCGELQCGEYDIQYVNAFSIIQLQSDFLHEKSLSAPMINQWNCMIFQ